MTASFKFSAKNWQSPGRDGQAAAALLAPDIILSCSLTIFERLQAQFARTLEILWMPLYRPNQSQVISSISSYREMITNLFVCVLNGDKVTFVLGALVSRRWLIKLLFYKLQTRSFIFLCGSSWLVWTLTTDNWKQGNILLVHLYNLSGAHTFPRQLFDWVRRRSHCPRFMRYNHQCVPLVGLMRDR